MSNPARDVTRVLDQVRAGEPDAPQCLVDMVYEELRWMAEKDMRGEPSRPRRQPTQLVREAYLRLVGTDKFLRQNRAHFFAAAAEAMRRILVERARRYRRPRSGAERCPMEHAGAAARESEIGALSEALDSLASIDPHGVQVVKLRYFAGFTVSQTARLLGVTPQEVESDWQRSKSWLKREMTRDDPAA